MQHRKRILLALLAALAVVTKVRLPAASAAQFDGPWDVTLVCPDIPDGPRGYNWQFHAEVKDGELHAEHGERNQPGWMSIDGKIQANGDANFLVHGLTGTSSYNLGHSPKGLPYQHPLTAHFDASQGNGQWTAARICQFTFTKQ